MQRGVLARRRDSRSAASSRTRRAITAPRSRTRRGAAGFRRGSSCRTTRRRSSRRTCAGSARRCGCARRRSLRARRRATTSQRETGATLIHPVRRFARHRRAGNGGARARRSGRRARRGHRAVRRRRPAVRHVDRRDVAARAASRVFGAEPANADDAARSLAQRHRCSRSPRRRRSPTACARRCRRGRFARCARTSHDIGTCSEAAIVRAMRMMFERMKQVVEPSAAVPLACLLERTLDVARQARRHHRQRRQRRSRPSAVAGAVSVARGRCGAAARRPRRDAAVQDEGPSRHRDLSRRLRRASAPTGSSCSVRPAAASRRC